VAVVAYYLVDLDDDVLGDAGLYRNAINHLCEVDALLVRLSDRHLTEDFICLSLKKVDTFGSNTESENEESSCVNND
jgi:hypothetical protein